MTIAAHIMYILLWLSFGALHSLLASQNSKSRLEPLLGRTYRLIYNLFAIIHIGFVIYGGRYAIGEGARSFDLSPPTHLILSGLMLLGGIIFIVALFQYDIGRFAGVSQLLKPGGEETEEPLHQRGLHRFVRHPLYSGVYLYLWGSVQNEFDLVTAIWASIYLMIGSHFEEQKLIASYGDAYLLYKMHVPAVIPWRGRAL